MSTSTVAENFDKYFAIKFVNTDALRKESYRIRHSVYCDEMGWLASSEDGLETDECDAYSFSLLLEHKRTGVYAGTVRLVIPPVTNPEKKLPFELHGLEHVQKDVIDSTKLSRGTFGEISRLAVSRDFRRREGEQKQAFVINEMRGAKKEKFAEEERRNFPNIAIGLYLGIIALENMCNHSQMFVVVEPRLKKRLQRLGLEFIQCGEEHFYHGIRALFYLPREHFTSNLNTEMLELYQLLEDSLRKQVTLYPYLNM
ncbi:hypothetical protein GCM10009092_37650 [Bowmanella denitrificans]|uniref:PEP-CTERM/exosortase system-associated acyltransferase n=1 Tax=Bowmanella denitrificans TaxID=366582 RepID=A0ABN0XPX6_9ALTE